MSAQLTLTDAEMEALQRCVTLASRATGEPDPLSNEEQDAALSAYRKFTPHLNRKCRRRPRR